MLAEPALAMGAQRLAQVALALGAVALGACAAPRYSLVCPARGGPEWREVTTPHFSVVSDGDPLRARSLAADLETARAAIVASWFRSAIDPPGRLRVVALGEAALRELAPADVRCWYGPDLLGEPVAVLAAGERSDLRAVIHEVAHQLAASVFARQPHWFAEGLATFLETMSVEGEAVWIGRVNDPRAREAAASRVSSAELFAWRGGTGRPGAYGRSWLLVHYLVNHRPGAFTAFQKRLAGAEDPLAAFAAELPEFDPRDPRGLARLDAELDAHLRGGEYVAARLPFERPAPTFTERTLGAAEVHAVRLALPSSWPQARPEDRAAEIDEALREDPGHPVALMRRSQGVLQPERVALAREATRTHPDSWEAWAFMVSAVSSTERCAREGALRRAVSLAPENPRLLNDLAWNLVEGGRAVEALPLAEKAARLEPWSSSVLDTHAAAAAATGRCEEAVRSEERAVDLIPEGASAGERAALEDRLERYRSGCGGARRAPAPCSDVEAPGPRAAAP